MSPRNGVERILDVVDLKDGERNFLACITLQAEVWKATVFPILLSFKEISTACSTLQSLACISELRDVEAKRRCPTRTDRAAYSAHSARVSCEEVPGQQVIQRLWDFVGCDAVVIVPKRPELLVDSTRAENYTVDLLATRKAVGVQVTSGRVAARSTLVAKSSGARLCGISAALCKEIDGFSSISLCPVPGLSSLGAEIALDEAAHSQLDGGENVMGKRMS